MLKINKEHQSPYTNWDGSTDTKYKKEMPFAAEAATTRDPDKNAHIKRDKVILASNQGTVHSTNIARSPREATSRPRPNPRKRLRPRTH